MPTPLISQPAMWHNQMHPEDPAHQLYPVHLLTAWNIGLQACDCRGAYAEPDPHHNGLGSNLKFGDYLCRVVHENEFRYGTFLGYWNQPDCHLQQWGHFRPHGTWPDLAATGNPIQPRPTTGDDLAGDLTFENLTRNSRQRVWPEHVDSPPVDISGDLLLVDHVIGLLTGMPETVLWYSTPAYEAAFPRHDKTTVRRVTVPSTTRLYFDGTD